MQRFILPQVFFKHLASKNHLPGLHISATLVENEFKKFPRLRHVKTANHPMLISLFTARVTQKQRDQNYGRRLCLQKHCAL